MKIIITYGIGEGITKKAAFDKALFDAGIGNFNLIKLSSIIPPKSQIIVDKINWNDTKSYGDKLYVVISTCFAKIPKQKAWAGLGWIQEKKSGQGIFVEINGFKKKVVQDQIKNSLNSMILYRNLDPKNYKKIRYKIVGVKCQEKLICGVVVAIFKRESWN